MNNLKWARYWRNSLADADSSKGALSKRDTNDFYKPHRKVFATGLLNADSSIIKNLFENEADKVTVVKAHYRPVIYCIKKEHGKEYSAPMPELLSPILCPIWISREGFFFPADSPYIPRDVLSPQADDKFTIATVSKLDEFLTIHNAPTFSSDEFIQLIQSKNIDDKQAECWNKYYQFTQKLFKEVCLKNEVNEVNEVNEFYVPLENGFINKVDEVVGASFHILKLYDALLESPNSSSLFSAYTRKTVENYEPCLSADKTISIRLGHSNAQFPLAEAQRDALSHVIDMNDSDILAVNGPPGTGKTTFVLSAVASLWINAALKDDDPPLIIAASTNNQAVTNVIDAFRKDFDEGSDELSGRWLPEISGYGGYFPSATKEGEASKKYQTSSFYSQLENLEYLDRAEAYFLYKAQSSFTEIKIESIFDAKEHLLTCLQKELDTLNNIQVCWSEYSKQKSIITSLLGDDPKKTLITFEGQIEYKENEYSMLNDSLISWRGYLAEESIWFSVFSWLSFVRVKKEVKRKNFISKSLCSITNQFQVPSKSLERAIEKTLQSQKSKLDELTNIYEQYYQYYQVFLDSEFDWLSSIKNILPEYESTPLIDDIDPALDITIRFKMFRLAVHYWEARWLLTCRDEGSKLEENVNKTGLKAVLPRWKRRMMLTPCIVSTFHSLPSHMTYKSYIKGEGFNTEYLFNEIDLLIVDEAGQVSPEIAGASFSLAKKSLVIGDIYQIEPVRQLNTCVDIGNLKQSKIISDNNEYEVIQASGRSVTNGSVMLIAQQASRYHYKTEAESGMFLQEHRRCYNELISYCNKLCYKGLLIPKRGSASRNTPFPPFGYLHINGLVEQFNGSKRNRLEAETVAAWLSDNRKLIEDHFNEPLEKAVGVITPFSAQVAEIYKACKVHGISVGKNKGSLTVGTVHSLQGAERKLIIFSQVYTKHNNGKFIDMNTTMLNVAVSRAKDSFLVFGDMDIISGMPKSKPRGLLSKYLFEFDSNKLHYNMGKRHDLLASCGQPKLLHNAKEHDEFMMQLLDQVEEKIDIVSPWLFYSKLEEMDILARFETVITRGVVVTIHTDKHFNTTTHNQPNSQKQKEFESCCAALKQLGIFVNVIDGIHSKSILADDKCMAIGSFNWFSAARAGKFVNIETSLVYVGDLAKEIKTHLDFLNKRTYRLHSPERVVMGSILLN